MKVHHSSNHAATHLSFPTDGEVFFFFFCFSFLFSRCILTILFYDVINVSDKAIEI